MKLRYLFLLFLGMIFLGSCSKSNNGTIYFHNLTTSDCTISLDGTSEGSLSPNATSTGYSVSAGTHTVAAVSYNGNNTYNSSVSVNAGQSVTYTFQ
ncbi:MAG: hypothetical protein ACLQQ4_00660 [Bacteroidia bacterium]